MEHLDFDCPCQILSGEVVLGRSNIPGSSLVGFFFHRGELVIVSYIGPVSTSLAVP